MRTHAVAPVLTALALAALLASCGGEDGTETGATATTATTSEARAGPVGPLEPTAIGPVATGATEAEVQAAFGAPDRKFEVDLGAPGTGPAPQVTWSYRLEGGNLELDFATATGTFESYCSSSTELATAEGAAPGNTDKAGVTRAYGERLAETPIGTGGLILSVGKPGTYPGLSFGFEGEGQLLTSVCGGDIQPAGE